MDVALNQPTLHAGGGGALGAVATYLLTHASQQSFPVPRAARPPRAEHEVEDDSVPTCPICPIRFQLSVDRPVDWDFSIGAGVGAICVAAFRLVRRAWQLGRLVEAGLSRLLTRSGSERPTLRPLFLSQ
jgi:hypothetical protein